MCLTAAKLFIFQGKYKIMEARKPIVAGMFYEADKERLRAEIKACFLSELGPKSLPSEHKPKKIFGGVAPHAGYMFSGAGAACTYKEIAEADTPTTFIIIGPNHSGRGAEVATMSEDWDTPLGRIESDKELISNMVTTCRSVEEDKIAYTHEHSVEVQIPYLQFLFGKKIKFAPLLVNTNNTKTLEEIGRCIASINKSACVIASSDFTHHGINYGYLPFKNNIKENMYKLDKEIIKCITELDTSGFIEKIKKTKATVCGWGAILTTMHAVKKMGSKKGILLKYYTSGDVTKDYSNSVGYASIVFV